MRARPLKGRRIAITRPAAQAEGFAGALRALGADPVVCPTIRLHFGEDPEGLIEAAARVETYRWVVFTSANGVDAFLGELERQSRLERLKTARIAAIGPGTARALAAYGYAPALVPERFVAEAVATALVEAEDLEGARILMPRAAGARAVLPERLREAGAEVTVVEAYSARPDTAGIARLREAAGRGDLDMVTFTAASTVRSYIEVAGPDVGGARVAAIGPVTAAAARESGLAVDVVAGEHTIPGLVAAIRAHYEAATEEA